MSIAARFSLLVRGPIKYHIYVSRSHDVAANLSIEHYLFQKSHPTSIVLFLYVNKPCIVIAALDPRPRHDGPPANNQESIAVIRRRSGGGTVFHDLGNVNFSVIFPLPEKVINYKHAEMVVRAIRKTNPRARVNDRHDIVLDPGPLLAESDRPDPDDTRRTAYAFGHGELEPRKISGSAGKASGPRGLHHGTCLLTSPNLRSISAYLRSPATPYLFTKATPSTRSPVANIISQGTPRPTTSIFQRQIIDSFAQMYNIDMTNVSLPKESDTALEKNRNCVLGTVDDSLLDIPEIRSGYDEIQSAEWLYEQKREFILSSHICKEDRRNRPSMPDWFPPSARVYLKIKWGVIISSTISLSTHPNNAASEREQFDTVLKNTRISKTNSFRELLGERVSLSGQAEDVGRVGAWLDLMLGKQFDLDTL
ncbi:MAG: hypothetical protein Q9172_004782 [Xanthocarpia lactea]